MIGFVFEFYQLPWVWESGFWKVRNVRLLGLKCPVSFHKILQNHRVSLIYLSSGDWLKSDIWGNLTLPKYTKLGRTPKYVRFRILIILHNSMIFTPKSEVGFCVGWSERKRTKRRSNTEYSECIFAKQNKMSDYGVRSNNPIQFSGKSLPWLYFIDILSKSIPRLKDDFSKSMCKKYRINFTPKSRKHMWEKIAKFCKIMNSNCV